MTKKVLLIVVLLLAMPALVWAAKPAKRGKPSGMMNVQVREAIVRVSPEYLGSQTGTLSYGDQVKVVTEQGNWIQIESPSGWIPKSALTKHKVKVNPDQKFSKGSVKHDEVALAGKGFNPQVEAEYKKQNASLASAYATVDRVETFGATEAELKQFKNAGKLQ